MSEVAGRAKWPCVGTGERGTARVGAGAAKFYEPLPRCEYAAICNRECNASFSMTLRT